MLAHTPFPVQEFVPHQQPEPISHSSNNVFNKETAIGKYAIDTMELQHEIDLTVMQIHNENKILRQA